jgi:hypothetical protein
MSRLTICSCGRRGFLGWCAQMWFGLWMMLLGLAVYVGSLL